MSLYLRQQNTRSDLQEKLAKELQERAKQKAALEAERPDGVDDSRYIEQTKQTSSLAWVWVLIIVACIASALWLVIVAASQ